MLSMNFLNWRHDPYVEATYSPDKLERLATELELDTPDLPRQKKKS
jgi:hypothetical protein